MRYIWLLLFLLFLHNHHPHPHHHLFSFHLLRLSYAASPELTQLCPNPSNHLQSSFSSTNNIEMYRWSFPPLYTCRIPQVCVYADGTYALPIRFNNPKIAQVLDKCSIRQKIDFYKIKPQDQRNHKLDPAMAEFEHTNKVKATSSSLDAIQSENRNHSPRVREWQFNASDYDLLLSHAPPRYHIPHFMQDVSGYWVGLEMLYGTRNRHKFEYVAFHVKNGSRRNAFSSWDEIVSCSNEYPEIDNIKNRTNLVIPMEERLARPSYGENTWVKALLKSFVSSQPEKVQMKFIYDGSLKYEHFRSGGDPLCFRSVIFQPHKRFPYQTDVLTTSVIYDNLNLLRDVRPHNCDSRNPVQVLFLNRLPPRFMKNIKDIKELLYNYMEAANEKSGTTMVMNTKENVFESASFMAQVDAIRSVDVLIACHGAGITNGIFMRPESLVVDVFPWMYTTKIFLELLAKWKVFHIGVYSVPDTQGMYKCIVRENPHTDSAGRAASQEIFDGLEAAATLYSQNPQRARTAVENMKRRNKQHCLRHQSLLPNASHIAELVVKFVLDRVCAPPQAKKEVSIPELSDFIYI